VLCDLYLTTIDLTKIFFNLTISSLLFLTNSAVVTTEFEIESFSIPLNRQTKENAKIKCPTDKIFVCLKSAADKIRL